MLENDEVKEAEQYHGSSHVHAEDDGVAVGEARAHILKPLLPRQINEVRSQADRMVQLGKDGSLYAARRAAAFVFGDDVIHKLFTELAYRYKDRVGGYTRLLRSSNTYIYELVMLHRSTAYIEFIDRENELRQSPPPRVPLDPWTRSKLCKQFAPPKEDKTKSSEI